MEHQSRHQCLIYKGAPSRQLSALAAVIKEKLGDGMKCLYLNSPTMVAGMRSYLSAIDIDVESEIARNQLVLSSASCLSVDGSFDVDLMLHNLEHTLDGALFEGNKGLWASGDMTWEFGSEKNFTKLLEYEYRLEKLFLKRQELCGICQYHEDTIPHEATQHALLTHPMIFINETLSHINAHYVPNAFLDPPSTEL